MEKEQMTLICFSGDFDKMMANFVLATGGAASGMQVDIFFTFWGITALRKRKSPKVVKSFLAKIFGFMLPKGVSCLPLSKMNMLGMGPVFMKMMMKQANVEPLENMIQMCEQLGVKFRVCEMSMSVMGIKREELIDYSFLDECGAATAVELASRSKVSYFI